MEYILGIAFVLILAVLIGFLFLLILDDVSPKIATRVLSFLTNRELVWLKHYDGDVTLSLVYEDGFGRYSYVYPLTKVGQIRLNEDGTASSYIDKWSSYQDSE